MKRFVDGRLAFFLLLLVSGCCVAMEEKSESQEFGLCALVARKNVTSKKWHSTIKTDNERPRTYFKLFKHKEIIHLDPNITDDELFNLFYDQWSEVKEVATPMYYTSENSIYLGLMIGDGRIPPSLQQSEQFVKLRKGKLKKCTINGEMIEAALSLFKK